MDDFKLPISKEKLDGFAEKAKKASEKINEYVKTLDEVTDVNTIKNLLKVSKALNAVSYGLAAVGVVFGIISFLSNEKSDTELILDAIDKVSAKIDQLENAMLDQFKKLEGIIREQAALTQLQQHLNSLNTLQDDIEIYYKSIEKDDETLQEQAKKDLLEYDIKTIREAAKAIENQATGKNLATNLFDAIYITSYGNLKTINQLGAFLKLRVSFAMTAEVLIKTLKEDDISDETLEAINKDADEFYHSKMENVYNAWERNVNRCLDDYMSNLKRKVNAEWKKPAVLISPNYADLCEGLVKMLKEHWFWRDWAVVIYDGVGGWDHHAMVGGSFWWIDERKTFYKNIIIHSIDSTNEARGKDIDTIVHAKSNPLMEILYKNYQEEHIENGQPGKYTDTLYDDNKPNYGQEVTKEGIISWGENLLTPIELFNLLRDPDDKINFSLAYGCLVAPGTRIASKASNPDRLLHKEGNDTTLRNKFHTNSRHDHALKYNFIIHW